MAAHCEVAMHPEARDRAPVILDVTLVRLPQAFGQADRAMAQHQFADFAIRYALARHVDDFGADAERWARERAGIHWVVRRSRKNAAANFGAAGDVDDRKLAF